MVSGQIEHEGQTVLKISVHKSEHHYVDKMRCLINENRRGNTEHKMTQLKMRSLKSLESLREPSVQTLT